MSDIEIGEEVLANPAEPLPDVSTVAEAGQPVEPEVGPTVDEEVHEMTFTPNDDTYPHHIRFLQNPDRYSWTAENEENEKKETKFTQTFFKFMKNLSDKRFVEIINMKVDHENKSMIFYRPSTEFILSDFIPSILQIS